MLFLLGSMRIAWKLTGKPYLYNKNSKIHNLLIISIFQFIIIRKENQPLGHKLDSKLQ